LLHKIILGDKNMSRVYKKPLYRPVPENAAMMKGRDGKCYACWNNNGKEKKALLVNSKNGNRIVEESKFYIARFTDANGRFRERSTGCCDKKNAEHKLHTWLHEIEKVKSGILTQEEFEISKQISDTIANQLLLFVEYLRGKSATLRYIKGTTRRIEKVCTDCNFKLMAEMNNTSLIRWLNKQSDTGMGACTRNNYLGDMINFCRWAVNHQSLAKNPFEKIPKVSEQSDKRHERRALNEAEIILLLKAAEERPIHELTKIRTGKRKGRNETNVNEEIKEQAKRTGLERKLLYATFIYTGLRKNELASITVGQVFIDAEIPYIILKAKDEKSRRGAMLPLHPELTEHLKQWLKLKGNISPKEKLFYVPNDLCNELTRDLEFAGIEKRDTMNRVVDVHALRHTHATLLAKRGVSPTVAKKSMRHSDLKLTMEVYTHLDVQDVAQGVNQIPNFLNEK
jgi:integrase